MFSSRRVESKAPVSAGEPSTLRWALRWLAFSFLVATVESDVGYWWTGEPDWAWWAIAFLAAGLISSASLALTSLPTIVQSRVGISTREFFRALMLGVGTVNLVMRWDHVSDFIIPTGLALSIAQLALSIPICREPARDAKPDSAAQALPEARCQLRSATTSPPPGRRASEVSRASH